MKFISLSFFLVVATVGFWFPTLTQILVAKEMEQFIRWAFILPSLATIISPLILGALADLKWAPKHLLSWFSFLSAIGFYLVYVSLDKGWDGEWFLLVFFVSNLFSVPAISLVSSMAMESLENPKKQFSIARMWGTLGWIVAGCLVSYVFAFDGSIEVFKLIVGSQFLLAVVAYYLPESRVERKSISMNWKDCLGVNVWGIFRSRNCRSLLLSNFLIAIPLVAFFMYTPLYLNELGYEKTSGLMTSAQILEIIALWGLVYLFHRFSFRKILICGAYITLIRYIMLAVGGEFHSFLWVSIALHGLSYSFFKVTSQVVLDLNVPVKVRSQAQALIITLNQGIGFLIGVFLVSWAFETMVIPDQLETWKLFWLVLTIPIAIATLYMSISYKGPAFLRRKSN